MIFVTGATGYTGRYVVDELLFGGASVRCLVRASSKVQALERSGVSLVEGDLERPDSLRDAIAGCSAVISIAHIRFAPSIIAACNKAGVTRAVFFSSTWRFSKVKTPVVDEVVAGEEAVEASGLDYTLLRPSMIFGPGDDRNLSRLRAFLDRYHVMPIFGSGENLVQPVYVADVAAATAGVLLRAGTVGKTYTLAGPEPMAYGDMIDTLAELAKLTVIKVHVPLVVALPLVRWGERIISGFPVQSDQVQRMGEDRSFDISAAQKELGFVPRSFEEGIREAMSNEQ